MTPKYLCGDVVRLGSKVGEVRSATLAYDNPSRMYKITYEVAFTEMGGYVYQEIEESCLEAMYWSDKLNLVLESPDTTILDWIDNK